MVTKKQSDSPSGGSVYLAIGFLRRPHGVGGEIIMDLHTDFPERIQPGKKVYIGGNYEDAEFESVRAHGNGLLIKVQGYHTPESAGRFRNQWVYVKADEVPPLPEGQHYKHELIGLNVFDEDGNPLGVLSEILETGANDVYMVRNEAGREILLPAIPSVILERDMDARTMKVHLLDGLIEEGKP
jgi:16S rRNA processing protein RimM